MLQFTTEAPYEIDVYYYFDKNGMMKMYYIKPTLKNLYQTAKLKDIRKFKYIDENDCSVK